MSYKTILLKLSEKYTIADYHTLAKELVELVNINKSKNNPKLRLIITHGTDRISTFASWIKILSLKLGFYATIIVAQRSHDRPTCQLHAILKSAIKILKSLKQSTAVCVTYVDSKIIAIHDPFEIRKIDTYAKNAFWSPNIQYVPRNSSTFKQKKERIILPEVLCLKKNKIKLKFDNFLESAVKEKFNVILMGSGLGNFSSKKKTGAWYTTKIQKGIFNPDIYGGLLKKSNILDSYGFKGVSEFSPEGLQLILNLVY